MIALYILLGLALIIGAILLFPYTVVIEHGEELLLYKRIAFFDLPMKGGGLLDKAVPILKEANSFLKADGKKKSPQKDGATTKQKKRKQEIDEILEVISLSAILLGRFLKYLRVRVCRFNIKVATGDPATAALAYGATNHAVGTIYSLIEDTKNIKNVKRAQINVSCDFFADTPEADIRLEFSLRIWQAIAIVFSSAIKHAKNMVEKDKKRAKK